MIEPDKLAAQYKDIWDRDGYVVIRGFYGKDEAAALQARFDEILAEDPPRIPRENRFLEDPADPETVKYLSRLAEFDPYFDDLCRSDRFVKLAEGLMGDGAVPKSVEWFNKCSKVGRHTPPHQDGYYYMIEPNEGVHFWLALDDVDEGNGCVRYMPGSHRRGMRHHVKGTLIGFSQAVADYSDTDEAQMVPTRLEPGDLLAHHTLVIHRADANTSDRERRAMGVVYYAARANADVEKSEAYRASIFREWEDNGKI